MAEQNDARGAAISRLKAKRGLQAHLVSYVVLNIFLVAVWAMSGRGYFWPVWVIVPWGLGLVMHAWTIYGQKPITEEEIQREMGRGEGVA